MIRLKEIDRNNFEDVIRLSVAEDQKKFVATNVFSIAQAKALPECMPLAVYDDDTPVGFVMTAMDGEDREYWIYRLMIDQKYQGKGYGRAALLAAMDVLARDKAHSMVYISFEPENHVARRLYESAGFRPDGREVGGETVYCLRRTGPAVDFDAFFERMRDPRHAFGEMECTVRYGEDDEVHYRMGCLPERERPYWFRHTGPDGQRTEYETADEFVRAPEFRGRSLRDIWHMIEWGAFDGMDAETAFGL